MFTTTSKNRDQLGGLSGNMAAASRSCGLAAEGSISTPAAIAWPRWRKVHSWAEPKLISKWMTAGKGVHRYDYDGRYAYISPTAEGFVGNIVMGVVFGLAYLRLKRVGPLVAAHFLLDLVAFVGYSLLAPYVDWL